MKKNLMGPSAEAEIIERILRLRPDSKAKWGTMNATEMLYHCNLCNQQVLEEVCDYKKPSLGIRLKKLIVFNVLPRIPKNNKGPARTHTKGRINDEQFDLQLKIYIDLIHRLVNHQQPFRSIHPALGFLNMEEWGFILWMHMDHHLRQFGV